MINLKLESLKAGFFDRKAVADKVDATSRRVLSKFGAFVRTRARSSIRRREGTSPAGRPPYSQTGLLKRFIFFAYDRDRAAVVIGPARLNGTSDPGAPERLEHGGTKQGDGRTVSVARGVGRDAAGRFTSKGRDRITLSGTLRYKPRPFMGPALEAERPQLPRLWKDSVR